MKCDDCLSRLEEYVDGETIERDAEQLSAHLITCAACAHEFQALTAEREMYARYDRELSVGPSMWNAIAARTAEGRPVDSGPRFSLGGWFAGLFAVPRYAFAGAAAVVVFALMIGIVVLSTKTREQQPPKLAANKTNKATTTDAPSNDTAGVVTPPRVDSLPSIGVTAQPREKSPATIGSRSLRSPDQSGVLFTDAAYTDIEDKDTADHVAQAENLLRSVRNLQISDDDEEVDVSYEKATSRRLLNENVVLRRDAEMNGKYPAKKLLGELEPFLIDIANLPDKPTPTDLRAIKDRVQKTEIVAALRSY
jgi:hypothetical protein